MKRITGRIAITVMLAVVPATVSHAWYYYANATPDDAVWEEVSLESETLPAGTVIAALPNGARSVIIERTQYFVSGGNWFLPVMSKDGVKYQVVFAPV